MTWFVVARKDLQDAIRSKALWVISLLFILLMAGAAYLYTQIPTLLGGSSNQTVSALALLGVLGQPIGFLVPIIALLLGYNSLAGESESGSIKLLLSLPHSRWSVVFGKLVGRSMVLSISILIGFAVATVVVLALYPKIAVISYVLFISLTVVLGIAYVAIGVGISALTKSTSKAAAAIFGIFILFNIIWQWIGFGIYYLLNGALPVQVMFIPARQPSWLQLFQRLSPAGAFNGVTGVLLDPTNPLQNFLAHGNVPFYLAGWFALVTLLVWVLLPITLGNLRFQRVDL